MGFLFGRSKILVLATGMPALILGHMDMFTGDMEEWLHHPEVDDTRQEALLRSMLNERDIYAHEAGS
jgi:hypothetical protein